MTPNPTPADRLEAALNNSRFATGRRGGTQDEDYLIYEAALAHLADLRRENTRTASASMEAWQPIETFPRDKAESRYQFLGGADGFSGEVWYNKEDDKFYLSGSHPTDHVDGSVDFLTHWQPLPAPPTALEGEE